MNKLAILLMSFLWCASLQAEQTTRLECPATIMIEDVAIDKATQDKLGSLGWKTGVPQLREVQLSGFSLMLGHDEPYADQQADTTSHSKSGKYLSSYATGGASDVSIRCDYQLGLVRLVKHLDGQFKRCQVTGQMKGKQFNPNQPNFISSHQWTCFK
ncbi:MAG: hypothetical protein QE278_05300 [Limnobacter sp.]|nr:hypothetical protein [Limnobacter sp.]